ncbi:retrovirus-related pol polyprotein from transposon TNT 1-94 [Tanacetum coccineum]
MTSRASYLDNNPFNQEISEDILSKEFKIPKFQLYDATTNPDEHLHSFKGTLNLYNLPDPALCNLFNLTLRGRAIWWFCEIPSHSISSFSHPSKSLLNGLMKQILDIGERSNQQMIISSFIHGLRQALVKDLVIKFPLPLIKFPTTIDELMVRAYNFYCAEEAIVNRMNSEFQRGKRGKRSHKRIRRTFTECMLEFVTEVKGNRGPAGARVVLRDEDTNLVYCIREGLGTVTKGVRICWNQFPSSIATALICLSTDRVYNFSRFILEGMIGNVKATKNKFLMYPRFLQMIVAIETADRTPRPTFGFTKKLFANMKFKWEGQPIPLTPLMLAIAAAGDDTADEEHAAAHAAVGSTAEAHLEPHSPIYLFLFGKGQFGNQRTMTVAGTRETVGSPVVQQIGIQCFNCKRDWPLAKRNAGRPKRDERLMNRNREATFTVFMAKIQEVLPEESTSTEQPLEQVQNNDENNVFANERQHSENNTAECADERVALANLIANLTLDTEENKMILKQLKKANASLTQELEECKTNLDETIKECECLAQKLSKQTESVNKEVHNKLLKSFAKLENHSISLKLALQQCKEQMKNNSVCKENGSNVFRKEREQYHEIQDLKAQMQDKNIAIISEPSVVRQPNAQQILKPSVLGKPTPFSNSPEMRSFQMKQSVNKTNVLDGLFKQVTQQNLPQNRKQAEIHSNIVQLILFIVDSGCIKHMTGNLKLLVLNKEMVTIKRVFTSKASITSFLGLSNSVCGILEVAFKKSTCFVRDLQGNDLLTSNRGSDLYTISLQETTSSTPICFMVKALPTQAWLWHRRLSYLNFDYITLLSKKDVMTGLPKLKYVKDQLCSSCEMSKAKRSSFKSKVVPSSKGRLNLLHMDLCGPMRVASINGKKYILTQLSKTPEQNGVVERQNRTLIEAARTMLPASKLPLSFWAEAVTTACYTQNRSIIISTHGKTAYHIINDKKPSIKHLHIFGCICYITRDGENLDKMKEKGDPCVMVGYFTQSKGYRVYTRETVNS